MGGWSFFGWLLWMFVLSGGFGVVYLDFFIVDIQWYCGEVVVVVWIGQVGVVFWFKQGVVVGVYQKVVVVVYELVGYEVQFNIQMWVLVQVCMELVVEFYYDY